MNRRPGVRRFTLNRPEKRNALNNPLRGALLDGLRTGDADPAVRVMIVRGAGTSFSAGYDLGGGNEGTELPFYTPAGDGQWPRHVTEGWMSIWDLSKPVIAQVHGYCLAGGSELATGCDLVYVATDAKIGYPAVRFGVPDMHFHSWLAGMRHRHGDDGSPATRSAAPRRRTGDGPTGRSPPRRSTTRSSRSHSASRSSRPTSCSSTSGWSTGAWRSWACARRSGLAPSCAPLGTHQASFAAFHREDGPKPA